MLRQLASQQTVLVAYGLILALASALAISTHASPLHSILLVSGTLVAGSLLVALSMVIAALVVRLRRRG
jgi:hypothetical protein